MLTPPVASNCPRSLVSIVPFTGSGPVMATFVTAYCVTSPTVYQIWYSLFFAVSRAHSIRA